MKHILASLVVLFVAGCDETPNNTIVAPDSPTSAALDITYQGNMTPPVAAGPGSPATPCTIIATPTVKGGESPYSCEWITDFDPLTTTGGDACAKIQWTLPATFGAGGLVGYLVQVKVTDNAGGTASAQSTDAFDCTAGPFNFSG